MLFLFVSQSSLSSALHSVITLAPAVPSGTGKPLGMIMVLCSHGNSNSARKGASQSVCSLSLKLHCKPRLAIKERNSPTKAGYLVMSVTSQSAYELVRLKGALLANEVVGSAKA